MAKTVGLQDFFVQLNDLVDAVDSEKTVKVAKEAWDIVGDQIRANALGADLVLTGLLVDPRTILTHAGFTNHDGKRGIFAEAGVFKSDSVMGSYPHPSLNRNRSAKSDIPPAMVAYWLEFGVQPHYTIKGIRARKNPVDAAVGVSFHQGIAPIPFISSAYDSTSDKALQHLESGLGDLIDKAIKT